MSPQLSAMPSAVPSASRCRDSSSLFETETANGNVSNLTTIIQAADEAYRSAHVRLDTVVRSNADLPNLCQASGPRFALRKRKVSVTAPCEPTERAANNAKNLASGSSFLAGLFATDESDHYVTSDEGDSCPSTPVPQRKKARLGRCSKSYASFAHLSGSTRLSTRLSTSSYVEKSCGLQTKTPLFSNASKTKSSVDSKVLAESLQAAKDLADVVFPHLPATVSNADSIQLATGAPTANNAATSTSNAAAAKTHCISAAPSSADLSSQTVAEGQPVPALANNPHVEPELKVKQEQTELTLSDLQSFQDQLDTINKVEESLSSIESADSYGWFLPLDDEADHGVVNAYSSLSESGSSSSNLLAFQAPVSAKAGCSDHEAEVEWAKAADTIDDVLGDFF